MRYLPNQIFTLTTSLSSDQVIEKIGLNIEIAKKEKFKIYTKLFKGYILGNSFKLVRSLSYRNSFQAEIFGEIEILRNGTSVKLNMKLNPAVKVFIIIWCAFISLFLIGLIVSATNNPKIAIACFIPFGMLVFGYGLTMICFNADCNESKKILTSLLDAELSSA